MIMLDTLNLPHFCPDSRRQNMKRKKTTSPSLQFSQDLSKQPIRRCNISKGFISVQVMSSVFANVGVHHRLILMKGVLAARVVQLCVYHRALEQRKGQTRGQGSESRVQIRDSNQIFLSFSLPTLDNRIKTDQGRKTW